MRAYRAVLCCALVTVAAAGGACGKSDEKKPSARGGGSGGGGGGGSGGGGGGGMSDYVARGKRSEAEVQLHALEKAIKIQYATNAEFPVGDAPLTPATDCCAGPNHKCAVDAAAWQVAPWTALEFSIDQPSYFQYRYQSDGKTVTAIARGDLDCDGAPIEYTLSGSVVDGNPALSITKPTQQD